MTGNAFMEWLAENWKGIGALLALIGTNAGQLGILTLPSMEQAEISGAETRAAQHALALTAREWMEEIDAARADEKADCVAELARHGVTTSAPILTP